MADKETEQLPALLWDKIPENAESHPDYMAIQSLIYDESTPQEQAENFKDQGNQRLKMALKAKNRLYFYEAIKYYTKGIGQSLTGRDSSWQGACHCFFHQYGEFLLGNWRKALNDSQAALQWDPSNAKACFRGAKAALKLDEASTAMSLCESGLRIEPENKLLVEMQKEAISRNSTIRKEQERQKEELAVLAKEASLLLTELTKRNIRLCQSNFKVGKLKPFVDGAKILHWPVLFIYPETMQQDIIQDVSETDLISELLDVMFAPEADPLQWDTHREYRRDTVDVYYLANAGEPFSQNEMFEALMGRYSGDPELHAPKMYGDKSAFFCKVEGSRTIHNILTDAKYIVPGIPTFFIVARGSNYHERFLESVSKNS